MLAEGAVLSDCSEILRTHGVLDRTFSDQATVITNTSSLRRKAFIAVVGRLRLSDAPKTSNVMTLAESPNGCNARHFQGAGGTSRSQVP
jgi:hypothetical protein